MGTQTLDCRYGDYANNQRIPSSDDDPIYPCDDCGKMRSKNEGGTVFIVCDACWYKHYRPLIKLRDF